MKFEILRNANRLKQELTDPKIFVIHENEVWVEPLFKELTDLSLPFEEWFINDGSIDTSDIPPHGVFYNRMSASSHTREHRYAVELSGPILAWLELHGRRVINNRRALQLEVRKIEQYFALNALGLLTPRTIAASSKAELIKGAKKLNSFPFMFKPNRGGKGTGVQLFNSVESLERALENQEDMLSVDGINLVQEYIEPAEPFITRTEFVGGEFMYALKVNTTGGFELCPADECQIGDAFCPTVTEDGTADKPKFEIISNYHNEDLPKYKKFLEMNGMEVAAVEYITAKDGNRYIYDVNTNTNYNSKAEAASADKVHGMRTIAEFLGMELALLSSVNEKKSNIFRRLLVD